MGQKINPISLRIGIVKPWTSRWFFSPKGERYPYAKYLKEDEAIRSVIRKKIGLSGIAGIDIERTSNNVRVTIKAARPGFIIGQGGKGIEELTRAIERSVRAVSGNGDQKGKKSGQHLSVNVEELKRSEISASYVAQQIAWDMERRLRFRRTIKKYLDQIMQNKEARGGKITVSGRLDGAEIARSETLKSGSLPLQTLRANIDYGKATAFTSYGTVGVEVWIYKGEVFSKTERSKEQNREEREERENRKRVKQS